MVKRKKLEYILSRSWSRSNFIIARRPCLHDKFKIICKQFFLHQSPSLQIFLPRRTTTIGINNEKTLFVPIASLALSGPFRSPLRPFPDPPQPFRGLLWPFCCPFPALFRPFCGPFAAYSQPFHDPFAALLHPLRGPSLRGGGSQGPLFSEKFCEPVQLKPF